MIKLYESLKKYRKYVLFLCDLTIWNAAYYLSYAFIRNSFSLKGYEQQFLYCLLFLNICFSVICLLFKLYNKIWRYADIEDFVYAGTASLCSNLAFLATTTLILKINLGIRTYVLTALMTSFLLFLFRFVYRLNKIIEKRSFGEKPYRRLLIVGGGEAAVLILREISRSAKNEYIPICIADDDREKIGRRVSGVKVQGSTYEIPEICKKFDIEVILFSIYTITPQDRKRILDICAKTHLEVRIVPSIYDLVTANLSMEKKIRNVEVEDLLGRDPIVFDTQKYGCYLQGKNILVTGGGGSIGSELCRQIAKLSPQNLIILDIYENNAYNIQQELVQIYGETLNFEIQIASVRDKEKLELLFAEKNIDVIFHAAAHKHVPLMENNPEEAVKNNVFGTFNLITLADRYHVKKFVQISTDKAVNPTNVMGATKRICEMMVQSMKGHSKTEFVSVRFGNVLGSNGSVIPLFKQQIRNGGPVTVTHPDIIRYFMTIPEAVSLVLTAGGFAAGGEIFILDMGEPVKIKDLAENLIRLSGFVPGVDIQIEYTGLRPGEKLYEELLMNEEGLKSTENQKIHIGKPIEMDTEQLKKGLALLYEYAEQNDKERVVTMLEKIVPTYKRTLNGHEAFHGN